MNQIKTIHLEYGITAELLYGPHQALLARLNAACRNNERLYYSHWADYIRAIAPTLGNWIFDNDTQAVAFYEDYKVALALKRVTK